MKFLHTRSLSINRYYKLCFLLRLQSAVCELTDKHTSGFES